MNTQKDVIDFLSSPDAYDDMAGAGGSDVERRETHISVVFLVGDRAFKMKQAVRYPYLDFSTLEQRRRLCEREVAINARTAPDIYLNAVAVTREADGHLVLDGAGEPVEWLVAMRRFDDALLWSHLAEDGRLERRDFEVLADVVADFHETADVCDGDAAVRALATTIDFNAESMARHGGGLFDQISIDALFARTRHAYEDLLPVLKRRADGGRVRACHGDLHLGNIFMEGLGEEGQRPVVFDAIEFNEEFAHIDVFYDLSFLLMDVVFQVGSRRATVLMNRYLDRSGDVSGLALLPLLMSLRAAIRAHVSATAAGQHADAVEAQGLRGRACRYFSMAEACLNKPEPQLIAVGGLSGSGKSRMARVAAGVIPCMPGARVVRSDTLRKRLAGVGFEERLPPESYTQQASQEVYAACMNEARLALEAGHPVVLDAVFSKPEERVQAERLAQNAGIPFQGLWLEASEEVMRERVENRRHNASDATAQVVRMQADYDLGEITWHRIDSSGLKLETENAGLGALGLERPAE